VGNFISMGIPGASELMILGALVAVPVALVVFVIWMARRP
jgi:hypothetical protein